MNEDIKHFDYLEFIEFADKTEKSNKAKKYNDFNSSETGEAGWTGTKTYNEAYTYATNGWDAGVKMIESDDKINIDGTVIIEDDVVGAYVNVGNFLAGLPNTMTKFVDETDRNKDDLTIFTNLGYSCGNSLDTATEYCRKLIQEVNKAQSKYNVRIVGFFSSGQANSTRDVVFIDIKRLDERFVLNSLAFAFHPSFFRRIWFKYLETQEYISWGYGGPSDESTCFRNIKEFAETENLNEYWVIPSLQHNQNDWDESNIKKINLTQDK